nr:transposase [Burkholderia thailandensis]
MSTEAPKRTSRKGIPNHPVEFRRKLAKLACEPGVSVARLAMEHGVNTNLLFKWRRASLCGWAARSCCRFRCVAQHAQHQPQRALVGRALDPHTSVTDVDLYGAHRGSADHRRRRHGRSRSLDLWRWRFQCDRQKSHRIVFAGTQRATPFE